MKIGNTIVPICNIEYVEFLNSMDVWIHLKSGRVILVDYNEHEYCELVKLIENERKDNNEK